MLNNTEWINKLQELVDKELSTKVDGEYLQRIIWEMPRKDAIDLSKALRDLVEDIRKDVENEIDTVQELQEKLDVKEELIKDLELEFTKINQKDKFDLLFKR